MPQIKHLCLLFSSANYSHHHPLLRSKSFTSSFPFLPYLRKPSFITEFPLLPTLSCYSKKPRNSNSLRSFHRKKSVLRDTRGERDKISDKGGSLAMEEITGRANNAGESIDFNRKRAEGRDGSDGSKKNLQLKVRKLNPVNTISYVQVGKRRFQNCLFIYLFCYWRRLNVNYIFPCFLLVEFACSA